MNVIGYTRYPGTAKLLYAGSNGGPSGKAVGSGALEPPTSSTAEILQISDAAKAASDKLATDQAATTPSLKARVNKLFQEARDAGTFITFDSAKGGVWMDMSSFNDDELGKIALDRSHEFSEDLQIYAEAALNARVKVSLEPYEASVSSGDMRGHVSAIKLLYEQMSSDTRAALGWTPDMIEAGQKIYENQTKLHGRFDIDTLFSKLFDAAENGGIGFSVSEVKATK